MVQHQNGIFRLRDVQDDRFATGPTDFSDIGLWNGNIARDTRCGTYNVLLRNEEYERE